MIPYKASDADVRPFLEEVKSLILSLGSTNTNGVKNLVVLLNSLKSQLAEEYYCVIEKQTLLTQRKLTVDKQIESLDDNKYKKDNLETRYQFFKSNLPNLANTSNFMSMVSSQFDLSFGQDITELIRLRREQKCLGQVLDICAIQSDYYTEMKVEIDNLIAICQSL